MATILAFPVRRRRRRAHRMTSEAIIVVWPAWRHERILAYVVNEISGAVDEAAEQQLVEILEVEALRLEKLGISEPEILSYCYAFARRAWTVAAANIDEAAAQ